MQGTILWPSATGGTPSSSGSSTDPITPTSISTFQLHPKPRVYQHQLGQIQASWRVNHVYARTMHTPDQTAILQEEGTKTVMR